MSWFARSIANTLQQFDINEDNNDTTDQNTDEKTEQKQLEEQDEDDDDSPLSPSRGVKEDLSEITKTLTSKFWGVASFLAPPPSDEQSGSDPDDDAAAPEPISGIRRDFAEIGGRFRSGISKLSTNIDVSEITKIASNFLQMSPEGEAIGVTDEVVAFVRDITMHPETWLDFPLPDEEEDFELSDAQQEHALAVESLAPRLAALRIELCPGYMTEGSFWKVYFVLLHPRLEPEAAELLSTPEIVKARADLTQEMKTRSNSQTKEEESATDSFPYSDHKPDSFQQAHSSMPSGSQSESVPLEITPTQSTDPETEKRQIPSHEVEIVDKSVTQTESQINEIKPEDQNAVEDKDEDDWLNEDNSENVTGTTTTTTTIPIENDEDVSFSDLEEDDGDDVTTNYKNGSDSSAKDSRDWVQLGSDSSGVDP